MNKWQMITSVVVAVVAVFTLTASAFAQSPTPLGDKTSQALVLAINDEYKARAFYQAVIDRFGSVRPFANIVTAETAHIEALERLLSAYGLPVPPDTYAGSVQAPATLQEAAMAGIEAEKANVAMYDAFLTFVQEPDIVAVFTQLRDVSQTKHLPAFERYAANTSTSPHYLGPRWTR